MTSKPPRREIAPPTSGERLPSVEAPLPEHLVDGAREFLVAARADNTRAAYARAWAGFEAWCAEHGRQSLPASLETIAAWMTALAHDGRAPATISTYLAAVVVAHRTAGHAIDRKSPLIAGVWQGIARSKSRTPRQARPLLALELRDLLEGLGDDAIDVRDAALLSLGWAAALRRGELVGLDWQTQGGGRGFVTIDDRGISVTLVRSKSSQDKPVTVAVPVDDMPDAIVALKRWIELSAPKPGAPLFRAVTRHGAIAAERLVDRSVARIVKSRVVEASRRQGMSSTEAEALADRFSGHSLRAGYATAAAAEDVPQYRIQQHTRHRSSEMVARYVRESDQWRRSGLKGVWRGADSFRSRSVFAP